MSSDLNLNCWIKGDPPEKVFTITISKSEIVGNLQMVIYESYGYKFRRQYILADNLQLQKVNLPVDGLDDAARDHKTGDILICTQVLSNVFGADLNVANVHIIVWGRTAVANNACTRPTGDQATAWSIIDSLSTHFVSLCIYLSTLFLCFILPSRSPVLQFNLFWQQYWGNPLDKAVTDLPENLLDPELDFGDDLLPGSPLLDVFSTHMLVRAEYLRVFNAVKEAYLENPEKMAVVTGQPGIGKSFWIRYAVRRCLGEKQEVIWYQNNTFFSFSRTGVRIIQPIFKQDSPFVWCFVDSTDAEQLSTAISALELRLFPIYVTPPKEKRWNKLHQVRIPCLIIMDPWTRSELQQAAILLPRYRDLSMNLDIISERFENAGPSAQTCLQFTSKELKQWYDYRDTQMTWDTPEGFMASLLDQDRRYLRIGDISHHICLVRRSDSGDLSIGPISLSVRRQLLKKIRKWTENDRRAMLERFSRIPGASGLLGTLLESYH